MDNENNMSNAEKKLTPVKKTEKKVKHNAVKSKSSNAGVFTLIFLLSIATVGGLYLLWENQQKNSIKQQLTTKRISEQLTTLNEQQQDFSIQNIKQIQNIQTFQEKLRKNLTDIVRNNQYFRNDWLIAEAEYLIQLATYRLLLEKDVTTATVALNAADARLAEVADPALLEIRKILKNDLQALSNVQVVDLAGLSVTLTALSNNITNLPLLTPDPKTHKLTQVEKAPSSPEVSSLQELPAAIWKDIKSLIIVRNHQKPIQPLLAPGQHFFLVQNLALLFEQARLALLNGNNEIYQERLRATKKWIDQYFDTEHNITRNMLSSIDALQKFDINPTLPDISSTFSAVKKYRTQGKKPKIPATKAEEK